MHPFAASLTRQAFVGLFLLVGAQCQVAWGTAAAAALPPEIVQHARNLPRLRALIVAQNGSVVFEEAFRGPALDRAVNIKSASKTVLSALVGMAIDKKVLTGVDQRIAPLLENSLPQDPDPRLNRVTIGNLLSMQAGLERTSGRNYGEWIASPNWVRDALSRPFVDDPGGAMLYSTGSSHLLSALLTRVTKRDTLALAREWLGEPLGIAIPPWTRDPQGIYLGGNEMGLSPRALLRFGELYRQGGEIDGRRVLPESWIRDSWTPRTASRFTGDAYGYGWFMRHVGGHEAWYAWGYGGQILYVIPDVALTIVMTSDPDAPSRQDDYVDALHALVAERIVPALSNDRDEAGREPPSAGRAAGEAHRPNITSGQ